MPITFSFRVSIMPRGVCVCVFVSCLCEYFYLLKFLFLTVGMYVCMWVCGCLGKQEKEVRSPGAGVIGNCELTDKGSEKWTQVFWKSASALNYWTISSAPTLSFYSRETRHYAFIFIEESKFLRVLSFEFHCRVLLFAKCCPIGLS